MLQWNGYEPGLVGAENVLVPGEAASSNALPLSAVTVCATPSLYSTVMVAPGLTELGVVNAKLLIVMVEAVPPDWEVDEVEGVAFEDDEPPQATSATAHKAA